MKYEALEVLKNRRAIRAYKPEQITEEELNAVLEAGTFAPTGGGTQGVQIVAVQTSENVPQAHHALHLLEGLDRNRCHSK